MGSTRQSDFRVRAGGYGVEGAVFGMTDELPDQGLKLIHLPDANAAVGLAVRLMLGQPAYAAMPFGEWATVLCNQVGRGHYAFVVDTTDQVVGYAGWAITPEAKAEAWAEQGAELTDEDCRAGDCLIMNAWIAKDTAAHRFLVDAVRAGAADKKTIYFRRTYDDGRRKIVRMPVNDFAASHVARNAAASSNNSSATQSSH